MAEFIIFTADMNKEKFIIALGLQVKKIRTQKKMSLYRLAKNTGKAPSSVQRLEQGKITPSLYYLYEISKGLGVALEELIKGLP
jgi:putative transcriptional regulator